MGDKRSRGSSGPGRALLEAIALQAIRSCDPRAAVERAVRAGRERLAIAGRTLQLGRGRGRLLVLAFGKAAPGMFRGLAGRLQEAAGRRPVVALIVAPHGAAEERGTRGMRVVFRTAEHPVPGPGSFAAGRQALRLMASARAADDVIVLVSGGGSALLAAPLPPWITAAEKAGTHRMLVALGAPIAVVNTARKHLSALKGGRLAVAAGRAKSLTTLVVCDVDPEHWTDVASGPTLPDATTLDDLVQAIARYGFAPALPVRVLEALRAVRLPETPKPRDRVFRHGRAAMILSNRDLRGGAVRAGLGRGLSSEAMPGEITGPVGEAVEMVARTIESAPPGTRLLAMGGEVRTTPLPGGIGGRNQEFALCLALRMAGLGSRPWAFVAVGSDGIDGNSPAAGAFVDATTLERARALRLDPEKALRTSNSHRFFARLGDAIVTGPTGTNVRDLYLLLTGDPRSVRPSALLRREPPDPAPSPGESGS